MDISVLGSLRTSVLIGVKNKANNRAGLATMFLFRDSDNETTC